MPLSLPTLMISEGSRFLLRNAVPAPTHTAVTSTVEEASVADVADLTIDQDLKDVAVLIKTVVGEPTVLEVEVEQ